MSTIIGKKTILRQVGLLYCWYMQKFVLEKSKFFPMIAWGTIVCFTVFVFGLTLNLRLVAEDLRLTTENLESIVSQSATTAGAVPETAE
jgi:hypothetical protein